MLDRLFSLFKAKSFSITAPDKVVYSQETQFAEYVLEKFGGRIKEINVQAPNNFEEKCLSILADKAEEKYSDRIILFCAAGDGITPTNYTELKLKIECYIWAGSSRYDQIMEMIPNFISQNKDRLSKDDIDYYNKWLVRAYESRRMHKEALQIHVSKSQSDPWDYHSIVNMVQELNHLGYHDRAAKVIADAKKSIYYSMSGYEYHMSFHERNYQTWKQRNEAIGFDFPREEYFSNLQLPDPPVNLFKKYIDRAELSIGSSIVGKRNRDDYAWISENLPEMCPKSYGGYKRMKNQNTKNFVKLANACLEKGRNIQLVDIYTEQAEALAKIHKQEEEEYWAKRKAQETE